MCTYTYSYVTVMPLHSDVSHVLHVHVYVLYRTRVFLFSLMEQSNVFVALSPSCQLTILQVPYWGVSSRVRLLFSVAGIVWEVQTIFKLRYIIHVNVHIHVCMHAEERIHVQYMHIEHNVVQVLYSDKMHTFTCILCFPV